MSPILQIAKATLVEWLRQIDNDECDESIIASALSKVNAESKGYYNNNSFVTYDDGMRMLNIRDRATFKRIMDSHKCKCHKINNRPVGYLRSDIEKIIHEQTIH